MNMTQERLTDEQKWQAFGAKDARYDGAFFVAVRTTRIYCRPSCAAKPLRKNVEFFDTIEQAEADGYRACKRCHPNEPHLPAEQLAARATQFIKDNGHARLDALSAELHISPFHLQRTFKRVMGVSPLQFAKAQQVQTLKSALNNAPSATHAIIDAGFSDNTRAYEQLDGIGMTPREYMRGGGMRIGFTITDSMLGRTLIAATERGLCAVYFGDDDAQLERELRAEYPSAHIERHHDTLLSMWAREVVRGINASQTAEFARLPLDVRGTAFQAKVWQALRQIPRGETRSYADLARAIGEPSAYRAVANACGANRVAAVIPCHRAVRENGARGGYRWGVERKAKLLQQELAP